MVFCSTFMGLLQPNFYYTEDHPKRKKNLKMKREKNSKFIIMFLAFQRRSSSIIHVFISSLEPRKYCLTESELRMPEYILYSYIVRVPFLPVSPFNIYQICFDNLMSFVYGMLFSFHKFFYSIYKYLCMWGPVSIYTLYGQGTHGFIFYVFQSRWVHISSK